MRMMTCIEDMRLLARRRVPKMFFEYADRGSYAEETLRINRADLQRIYDSYCGAVCSQIDFLIIGVICHVFTPVLVKPNRRLIAATSKFSPNRSTIMIPRSFW